MIEPSNGITEMADFIRLAVTPIFFLTGIAGFLNVMSHRLSRIIDRARIIERKASTVAPDHKLSYELRTLWRRVTLNHWSIGFCTATGLLVCTLIVSLFIGAFGLLDTTVLTMCLFLLALLCMIFSLILFLKEIQLATRTMRIGTEFLVSDEP